MASKRADSYIRRDRPWSHYAWILIIIEEPLNRNWEPRMPGMLHGAMGA